MGPLPFLARVLSFTEVNIKLVFYQNFEFQGKLMNDVANNNDRRAHRDICNLNVHRACSPNFESGAVMTYDSISVSELKCRVVVGKFKPFFASQNSC